MAGLNLPSRVGNFAYSQTPLARVPGVGGAVGGVVGAGLSGAGLREIGQSAIGGGIASLLATALPGLPGLPGLGGSLAADALSENPNPVATTMSSAASTAGSLVGAAAFGPLAPIGAVLGGTLAGYYANRSLQEGTLGDIADSRSREKERDAVESGLDVGSSATKGMAMSDKMGIAERDDGYGFGLTSNYGATTAGQLDNSAGDVFGAQSLSDYGSSKYGTMSQATTNDNSSDTGAANSASIGRVGASQHTSDEGDVGIASGEASIGRTDGQTGGASIGRTGGNGNDSDNDNDGSGANGATGGDKDGGRY